MAEREDKGTRILRVHTLYRMVPLEPEEESSLHSCRGG